MIVILGLDGLEYEYVKSFDCKNLMQADYGKTDISEFSEARTVVLWSSFLAGSNLEKKILSSKRLWDFRLKPEETFFTRFERWKAIDVPGFTFIHKNHKVEREALKKYFSKEISIEEYDKIAFKNYNQNKKEFLHALNENYEIVMAYFGLADVIGHLSFGLEQKMKIVYKELDELSKLANKKSKMLLILSDHGMIKVGRFGDHSKYGFWSFSKKIDLQQPRLTELAKLTILRQIK